MKRALLDVNVLLALLDGDHVQHVTAREWFRAEVAAGWASCGVTQNGFVRIISQPRYPSPVPAAQAIVRLATASAGPHHQFLPSSVSILDSGIVDPSRILSSRQITDVYLLALAVANDLLLVTFDQSIPLAAVSGASTADMLVLQ
ncbi:MAG: VapC toxin family PIN domain ribonuclease [Actinomycetota bacterium]|nr:VapC toxin family PIN domain ribonuclease [Actinomycetota bacterium]